jgi:hypothetical protein
MSSLLGDVMTANVISLRERRTYDRQVDGVVAVQDRPVTPSSSDPQD